MVTTYRCSADRAVHVVAGMPNRVKEDDNCSHIMHADRHMNGASKFFLYYFKIYINKHTNTSGDRDFVPSRLDYFSLFNSKYK